MAKTKTTAKTKGKAKAKADVNQYSLEMYEERYVIRIRWIVDDDCGADLGEDVYTKEDLDKADADSRDHILACLTAAQTTGVSRDERGYYWEGNSHATNAFRLINTALKNDPGVPWPEWAMRAKAEGWKPPRGWKPS